MSCAELIAAKARARAIAERQGDCAYVFAEEGGGYRVMSLIRVENAFADGDLTEYEFRRDCVAEVWPKPRKGGFWPGSLSYAP